MTISSAFHGPFRRPLAGACASLRQKRSIGTGLGLCVIFALGCDTPQSQPQTRQDARSAPLERGASVRIAGQARCVGCSISDLERVLHARPRTPLPKEALELPEGLRAGERMGELARDYRWALKFKDKVEARLQEDPRSIPGLRPAQAKSFDRPLLSAQGQRLDKVEALRQRYHARFVPQVLLPESDLRQIRERALRRSLRAQPDLGGMYWVDASFDTPEEMLAFGRALQALDAVEFVQLEALNVPPPEDIPPASSDLSSGQGYLGPDPGVDGNYAWEQGYFGQGVRVSDCEYSWRTNHEDLVDNPIQVEKGQKLGSHEINHGTAVIGIVVAGHNGYGVKGLAPKAQPAVYPEGNGRRVQAISSAIRDSKEGDIVMLEMQTYGHRQGLVPAEYDKSVWTASKTGADAGVLVIAAAGNGNQNLDASPYKAYMDRGDSGAIIIGAGTADKRHSKMSFSTYGKRVDVQGWGEKVVTTGYGDLKKFGGDSKQEYTRTFAGTSSATPVVSGAAALIQSFSKEAHGKPLSPKEMRDLLKETGIAQQGGGNVGLLPNVKAAFEKLGKGKPKDETEPEVSITDPDKDIEVMLKEDQESHTLAIEVQAKDDTQVKEVHLEIDGEKIGEADDKEPYLFEVELTEGSYEIVAVATDESDNAGKSKTLKASILPFEEGEPDPSKSQQPSGEDSAGDTSSSTPNQSPDPTPEPGSEDSDSGDDTDQSEQSADTGDPNEGNGRGGCHTSGPSSLWFVLALGLVPGFLRRKH